MNQNIYNLDFKNKPSEERHTSFPIFLKPLCWNTSYKTAYLREEGVV